MIRNPFRVLAIETSCDDTAVAIVSSCRHILSNVIIKQHNQHQPYGGIVPKLAAALHRKRLPMAIHRCLDEAGGLKIDEIDAVAATRGPGLGPCLSAGFEAGRCIAASAHLPFFPVHHMVGHAMTARLSNPEIRFPFLALLISGGHTLLLVVKGVHDYTILGSTLDDSVGEALDKATRMLGLEPVEGESPAASLEKAAASYDGHSVEPLPIPMKGTGTLDFSFAGLKTALKYRLEKESSSDTVNGLAYEFQRVATAHLEDRLQRALKLVGSSIEQVVVSGGVARNYYIRMRLSELVHKQGKELFFAPTELCSDNAVMIAWAAIEGISEGVKPLSHDDSTRIKPEWPLDRLKLDD